MEELLEAIRKDKYKRPSIGRVVSDYRREIKRTKEMHECPHCGYFQQFTVEEVLGHRQLVGVCKNNQCGKFIDSAVGEVFEQEEFDIYD